MIKGTLEKAWEINNIKCALSMQRSLQVKFKSELSFEKGKMIRKRKKFTAIKVEKLSMNFRILRGVSY